MSLVVTVIMVVCVASRLKYSMIIHCTRASCQFCTGGGAGLSFFN